VQLTLTRLSCPSCGAPLTFSPGTTVVVCPFCHARSLIENHGELADVAIESRQIAPSTTDVAAFQQQLLAWLSEGDLTPDDILESVLVTKHTGLYLPLWRLTGEFHAQFTASAGYDRQVERIIERKQPDGSMRRDVRHVTETDWRPMSGEATGPFTAWILASGSVPDELRSWAEDVAANCEDWRELEPSLLEDHLVEEFGVTPEVALADAKERKLPERVAETCKARIPGDRSEDLQAQFTTRDEVNEGFLHPFWFAAFQYDGDTFPVAFSGRDLSLCTGTRPVDKKRKARVDAIGRPWKMSLTATLVCTVLGFCAGGVPGIIAMIVGGIFTTGLLWTAHMKKTALLKASKAVRQRVLERVRSGGLDR
jgi:LSD1 subclass zinc finger protein